MNRIRTLLATATVLAFVPFAAFAETDTATSAPTVTMTSVHTVTAGTFTALGDVAAFSAATDFGTVALTYSTNSVASGETSTITAAAGAWTLPAGATSAMPVLKATASAPVGTGAGTAAAQVTLISGANVPAATAQTLVTGITNGDGHTSTVTFAVDASDATIADGAYSTTVTFTLTASAL